MLTASSSIDQLFLPQATEKCLNISVLSLSQKQKTAVFKVLPEDYIEIFT
jgi:hypothetical protein